MQPWWIRDWPIDLWIFSGLTMQWKKAKTRLCIVYLCMYYIYNLLWMCREMGDVALVSLWVYGRNFNCHVPSALQPISEQCSDPRSTPHTHTHTTAHHTTHTHTTHTHTTHTPPHTHTHTTTQPTPTHTHTTPTTTTHTHTHTTHHNHTHTHTPHTHPTTTHPHPHPHTHTHTHNTQTHTHIHTHTHTHTPQPPHTHTHTHTHTPTNTPPHTHPHTHTTQATLSLCRWWPLSGCIHAKSTNTHTMSNEDAWASVKCTSLFCLHALFTCTVKTSVNLTDPSIY